MCQYYSLVDTQDNAFSDLLYYKDKLVAMDTLHQATWFMPGDDVKVYLESGKQSVSQPHHLCNQQQEETGVLMRTESVALYSNTPWILKRSKNR